MTNEIKVLIDFIAEFHPGYLKNDLDGHSYHELVDIVKEIVKEM